MGVPGSMLDAGADTGGEVTESWEMLRESCEWAWGGWEW